MARRLFNVAAMLSLALGVLVSAIVVWACGGKDTRAMARHGVMSSVSRTGTGDVSFATMPWPRDEPWTATVRGRATISTPRNSWHHDYVLVKRYGLTGEIEPGSFDPWGDKALAGRTPIRLNLTYFETWRIAGALMALPLAWAVWRFRPRAKKQRGFDIEPVAKGSPLRVKARHHCGHSDYPSSNSIPTASANRQAVRYALSSSSPSLHLATCGGSSPLSGTACISTVPLTRNVLTM